MKKAILLAAAFACLTGKIYAQNFGIGTATPSSKLNVNGSFEGVYKNINTAAYAVDATDYYLSYSGATNGTFTLPAAISGANNYGGRTYYFKNTGTAALTIAANGAELIENLGNVASIQLPVGWSCMLISKGTTSGSTWEVLLTSRTPVTFNQTALQGAIISQVGASTTGGDNNYADIVTMTVTVPATGRYSIEAKAFFATAATASNTSYSQGAEGSFKLEVDGVDYDETYIMSIGIPYSLSGYNYGLGNSSIINEVLQLTAGSHTIKIQGRCWAVVNVSGTPANRATWGINTSTYTNSGGIDAGKCRIQVTYIN